jgi:PAS domain S-box-containing protein
MMLSTNSILIVDDDPDIREALGDSLEYEGYQVQTVGAGRQAIERVKQAHFGAVLLDVGLPDLDGLSVLKVLRELDPKLPIIIFTAYTSVENTVGSLSKGAFAYLTKPYNLDEIKATIKRAISVKALAVKAERTEHALAASEDRFRSVVESATDAIVLADQAGNIISWNNSAERLFGYTEEEVLGQPLTLLMPARYRQVHQRGLDRLRSMGTPQLIGKTIELRGQRKDGSEFPLELSLGTWKSANTTLFSGIIRDISERKRVEEELRESRERFRELADNIKEVFWMTDPQKTQMLYVSRGYEEIWGRTCESLYASPRSWLDAVHPEDRDRVFERALRQQVAGCYDEEYRIVQPDGAIRWIRDRAFPVRDESGVVYRIAGVAEDMTERKQIQEQLIQVEKLASLGTLVSGMAHEINNPAQGILGMAELIMEESDPDTIKEYAKDIVAYSQHIATVVRDFACYARPASRDGVATVDICERLTEAVKMVRRSPQFGLVDLATDFQPVPRLRARRTEIDQVFVNLISNAVQAMEGKGQLTLRTRHKGNTVTASIDDTGCGIPKELLNKIFDPFFTTKKSGKGTGLGLSIVYKIVSGYGGTITVESQEGKGTTFIVQFPIGTSATKEAGDGNARAGGHERDTRAWQDRPRVGGG